MIERPALLKKGWLAAVRVGGAVPEGPEEARGRGGSRGRPVGGALGALAVLISQVQSLLWARFMAPQNGDTRNIRSH